MHRSFALFLLCVTWLFPTAFCHATQSVSANATATVARETVHLSDIFTPVPPEKDKEIAAAPLLGKSLTYDAGVLTRLARQNGLAWAPASPMDKTVVIRASRHLSSKDIERAILETARQTQSLPETSRQASLRLVFDSRTTEIILPPDHSGSLSVSDFSYDPTTHRFRAQVLPQNRPEQERRAFTGRLLTYRSVPVATRRLTTGTLLSENDIAWIEAPDERLDAEALTRSEDVVGKELRRDVMEGSPLRARDVSLPRLVLRGENVMLKVETPMLLISTQGRALEDGGKGALVRVKNSQSNRVVEGIVEAPGVVRVGHAFAPQKTAMVERKD